MDTNQLRVRYVEESNYYALFTTTGNTHSFKVDPNRPSYPLPYSNAESYDIAINNKCAGGCDYCYIESVNSGENYPNIVEKVVKLFDRKEEPLRTTLLGDALAAYFHISKEEAAKMIIDHVDLSRVVQTTKPFQIAIGGAGEPTMHPDFAEFLAVVRSMGIVPNYTTNGMNISKKTLRAASEHAGGVSVSLHKHLAKYWKKALRAYGEIDVELHAHIIIYDESSIDEMLRFHEVYPDVRIILLPFRYVGFGENYSKKSTEFYNKLFDTIVTEKLDVGYGAGFYDALLEYNPVEASLFPPHDFSYYIDLNGSGSLYKTSFDWQNPVIADLGL